MDSSMSDPVAALYEASAALDTAIKSNDPTQITNLRANYQTILDATQSTDAAKQLAADFLPRYVGYFPELQDAAINAQLDLCEDPLPIVRIHAIKGLATVCKNLPAQVTQVGEMLGQLLVSEESTELAAVKSTLTALANIDVKQIVAALLNLCTSAELRPLLRPKAYEYLLHILRKFSDQIKGTPEVQEAVKAGYVTLLSTPGTVSADKFKEALQHFFKFHKKSSPETGSLVTSFINAQFPLPSTIDITDEQSVKQYLQAVKVARSKATRGVDTAPYANFFITQILPQLSNPVVNDNVRYELFKSLAAISGKAQAEQAEQLLPSVWELLIAYLPSGDATKPVAVEFRLIELLLSALHHTASKAGPDVAKQVTGIFITTGQPTDTVSPHVAARKEELQRRLTHLQSLAKEHSVKAQALIQSTTAQQKELKGEQFLEQRKQLGLQRSEAHDAVNITSNIQQLIPSLIKKDAHFSPNHRLSLHGLTPAQKEKTNKQKQQAKQAATKQDKKQNKKRKSTDNSANSANGEQANQQRSKKAKKAERVQQKQQMKSAKPQQKKQQKQRQKDDGKKIKQQRNFVKAKRNTAQANT